MTVHAIITAPTAVRHNPAEALASAHTLASIAETMINRLKTDGDQVLMNDYDREQIVFLICETLNRIEEAQSALP
jgi:hypothetical protein